MKESIANEGTVKLSRAMLLLFFVISGLMLSFDAYALESPTVFVEEGGNITSYEDNYLYGNLSLDDDFEYRAFNAVMSNFSYYNYSVPQGEKLDIGYERNFDGSPFSEKVDFFEDMDDLTIRYNLTSGFEYDNEISMDLTLPDFCEYIGHSAEDDEPDLLKDGNNLTFDFYLDQGSSYLLNVTCRSSSFGEISIPGASYDIDGDGILPEYNFNVLPRAFFSTEKERISDDVETSDDDAFNLSSEWRGGFTFTNDDDIPIEINNVRLWAIPVPNTTGNPDENIIFDNNYTSCINTGSNIMEKGDSCIQSDEFYSRYVPTIWSEVDYDVIWDFNLSSIYSYQSQNDTFDFDFFMVYLENPEDEYYAEYGEEIDLGFSVTLPSTCSPLTNKTGEWKTHDQTLENVTEGNFTMEAIDSTGSFDWNVMCETEDGSATSLSRENRTINVNKLQENIIDIPDIEWNISTNYTFDNVSDYFWDKEDDELNFSVEPDPITNISTDIDNEEKSIRFIPDPLFYGPRSARVVSTDPFGRNVSSNVFTLNVTAKPEITFWNITNGTWWTTEDEHIEVDVNTTLNFTADAEHPGEPGGLPNSWFYWFVDGVLEQIGRLFEWYVDFVQYGTRNVTLVVNDTYGMYDTQTWMINATRTDVPPGLNTIPNKTWKQNTTLEMNLTDWFYDHYMEDHNFSYDFTGDLENLTVDIDENSSMMNITPDENWIGIEERWMTITAENNLNLSTTSNNFTLTVYPYISDEIPDVALYTNLWNDTINLSDKFNDEHYLWEDLQWSAFGDDLDFILNPENGILNITTIDGWTGNRTVRMEVENEEGWNDTEHFNVEALPVNLPPEINDSNYSIMQNTTFPDDMIDLWEISFDPDDPYENLDYEILSHSNTSLMECEVAEGRYIVCDDPHPDDWGMTELNVSVSDNAFTDYATIKIEVEKFIHPPDIHDWTIDADDFFLEMDDGVYEIEFFENNTLEFLVNVSDIENRTMSHRWNYSGTRVNDTLLSDNESAEIHFDFHSSGDYTVDYTVNNSDGGISNLQWNLSVTNRNRPPTRPDLTHPLNDTFHTEIFTFNWTESMNPDAEDPNEDDFWEVFYLLQVSRNDSFRNLDLDMQFQNTTSFQPSELLPDGHYHWRVLAYDGADSTSSEVWQFTLAANPPDVEIDLSPEIAEYNIRDVDINWSVSDPFLDDYHMNITYPDGNHMASLRDNITLTPDNLTQIGDYEIEVYANDTAGNIAHETVILSVIEDVDPPEVTLHDPHNVSIVRTSPVIFDYSVDDINDPETCRLYIQEMDIIYDPLGGIISKQSISHFDMVQASFSTSLGENTFVYGPLDEGSYSWNVECEDASGNRGMADGNFTFRLLKRDIDVEVPEYPVDNVTFEPSDPDARYSLDASVPSVSAETGERTTGVLRLENTGDRTLTGISFLPSNSWIYFDTTVSSLDPGESVDVEFTMDAPVQPGNNIFHIGITSDQLRRLATGYVQVHEIDEIPLFVNKRVYSQADGYNVSFTLTNNLMRDINIYLEDYVDGKKGIAFSAGDFHTSGTDPPYIAMSRTTLGANETYRISYTASEIDMERLREPLVMSDVAYSSSMEIVSPHNFNILLYRRNYTEIIMMSLFIISVLAMFVLYYLYVKYEKERFLSGK